MVVLIETLWNVNKPRLMDWEQDGDSINRNIVECKSGFSHKKYLRRDYVLIETLWNVNM